MTPFVYLVCLVLAALRIAGEKGEIFQALAHLWVGALVAVWWVSIDRRESKVAGWLVVALSVIEVLCFIASRMPAA
jgi:hypothetical protein